MWRRRRGWGIRCWGWHLGSLKRDNLILHLFVFSALIWYFSALIWLVYGCVIQSLCGGLHDLWCGKTHQKKTQQKMHIPTHTIFYKNTCSFFTHFLAKCEGGGFSHRIFEKNAAVFVPIFKTKSRSELKRNRKHKARTSQLLAFPQTNCNGFFFYIVFFISKDIAARCLCIQWWNPHKKSFNIFNRNLCRSLFMSLILRGFHVE